MGMVRYEREPGTPLTEQQRQDLESLKNLKDEDIDFSDIPPITEEMWKNAVRGKFYRPVKKAVSLRLDADVIEWLKKDGDGYQTRANQLLRERMLEDLKAG
ncbi:MAG: BrnA antitoxin family protein [Acidobacteriota bacterium]